MSAKTLGVVDYGVGNIANVIRCLERVVSNIGGGVNGDNKRRYDAYDIRRVSKPGEILSSGKIILPGVGAFGNTMRALKELGLDIAIKEFARRGDYLLGICLGAQLLFETSYEFGEHSGLGLIKGKVVKFDFAESLGNPDPNLASNSNLDSKNLDSKASAQANLKPRLKIPHVGWNKNMIKISNPIVDNLESGFYLYFTHSYHIVCEEENIITNCDYGLSFPSIVNKDNIFGIQAHPERSHNIGFTLIENFVKL